MKKRIYLDCHEDSKSSSRTIKEFTLDGKTYYLDECVAGGVDLDGEAKGCQNFVCIIGRKRFFIYCDEKYTNGQLIQKYFVLKDNKE